MSINAPSELIASDFPSPAEDAAGRGATNMPDSGNASIQVDPSVTGDCYGKQHQPNCVNAGKCCEDAEPNCRTNAWCGGQLFQYAQSCHRILPGRGIRGGQEAEKQYQAKYRGDA